MPKSDIDWCDSTLSLWRGCSPIGKGCRNCWAARMLGTRLAHRFPGLARRLPDGRYEMTGVLTFTRPSPLLPIHGRCFVNPQADFFDQRAGLFPPSMFMIDAEMLPETTFIILTKRIARAKLIFENSKAVCPPNVWIGISCSTQAEVDRDMPILAQLPVQTKILSLEPLIEPVEIPQIEWLSWIVAGCESGPKKLRRHIDADAFYFIVEQCDTFEVPCYIKQVEIDGKIVHKPWVDCLAFPEATHASQV